MVLLSEIEDAGDAARGGEKMLAALAAPHSTAGKELQITVSIGISIYPDDGVDAGTLITCADTAMYRAKDKGWSNYQVFARDMNVRVLSLGQESSLHSTSSGTVAKAEAAISAGE